MTQELEPTRGAIDALEAMLSGEIDEPEWTFWRFDDLEHSAIAIEARADYNGGQIALRHLISKSQIVAAVARPVDFAVQTIVIEGNRALREGRLLDAHAYLYMAKTLIEEGLKDEG